MTAGERARARDLRVAPGIFPTGRLNAITDVAGVRVGHSTLIEAESVRTGVTAILPHGGNVFLDRVPAAIHVGNGFGKLVGSTQVDELGELETPILLASTLSVWRVADALAQWTLEQPGMDAVRSINPVVGETNDGMLNDVRRGRIDATSVRAALSTADDAFVTEGSVGAGTGTVCFGWKGGIGNASRCLPSSLGGHAVGVLVQANFGGILQVLGAPVGIELGRYAFSKHHARERDERERHAQERGDGSVMIVVATDAPLGDRNLRRLAARGMMGLARTGSSAANGSGDYVIAFSTAESARRPWNARPSVLADRANDDMSALFQAVVETTEEAVYNALFSATTMSGNGRTVEAIPLDRVCEILARHGINGTGA